MNKNGNAVIARVLEVQTGLVYHSRDMGNDGQSGFICPKLQSLHTTIHCRECEWMPVWSLLPMLTTIHSRIWVQYVGWCSIEPPADRSHRHRIYRIPRRRGQSIVTQRRGSGRRRACFPQKDQVTAQNRPDCPGRSSLGWEPAQPLSGDFAGGLRELSCTDVQHEEEPE